MRCQPRETWGGLQGAEVIMAELSSPTQPQQQEMESCRSQVSSAGQWVCSTGWWAGSGEALGSHHLCQQRAHPWGLGIVRGLREGIQLYCSCSGATVTIFSQPPQVTPACCRAGQQ